MLDRYTASQPFLVAPVSRECRSAGDQRASAGLHYGLVSLNHDEALASAFWGGGFLVIRGDTTAGVASDHAGTILRYGVGTNGRRVRRNYARYARR